MLYVVVALMILLPVAFYLWYAITGSDICKYIFYAFIGVVVIGCIFFSATPSGRDKDRYADREIEVYDNWYRD